MFGDTLSRRHGWRRDASGRSTREPLSATTAPLPAPASAAPSQTIANIKRVASYADLIGLGLLLLYFLLSNVIEVPLLPKRAPFGIQALGFVEGVPLTLQAVGMVLVLRSNRIINFAQVALGGVSSFVFYEVVHHSQL